MPIGIYKRTKKHGKAVSEGRKRSAKAQKQIKELHKRPKTKAQLKVSYENLDKMRKLPRTENQLKGHVFANDIVKHHNDFCHGALKPNDITCMTHAEHRRLHGKIECQNQKRDNKGRFIASK